MIHCLIIEDQGPAQEILEQYIQQTEGLHLVGIFTDVLEGETYLRDHQVDLLFLDINLPKMSGMEFLKRQVKSPITVLTTAYSEFALEAFEYNVIDYLLKPFAYERFLKAIQKFRGQEQNSPSHNESPGVTKGTVLYVKEGTGLLKVHTHEILFIKSDGDYTEVITTDAKRLTSHSLREWLGKLGTGFVQVHRSYIVHVHYIERIAHNKVHLGGEVIPVGRAYKHDFMQRLKVN